jgi:diketogulonate reductase-like aldo/keto reductase
MQVGMPGADPQGLLSTSTRQGTRVQAYRPLAQGAGIGSLLRDPTVVSIARTHDKSTAQVALRWVLQHGHTLATTTENVAHMRADLDVLDFALSEEEMGRLDGLDTAPNEPSIMCFHPRA